LEHLAYSMQFICQLDRPLYYIYTSSDEVYVTLAQQLKW